MGVYTEYFQKSKVFLYPLLEYRKGLTHVPKQTYCAWEDVYSIEDRMFLLKSTLLLRIINICLYLISMG